MKDEVAVQRLQRLIAAPAIPRGIASWTEVEQTLRFPLPSDYKLAVTLFGQGAFNDFLWMLMPNAAFAAYDLLKAGDDSLAALRELNTSDDPVPYSISSAAPEVYPWARTIDGDEFFWVRKPYDEPEKWTVAYFDEFGWEAFDCGAIDLLVDMLAGVRRPATISPEISSSPTTFTQVSQEDLPGDSVRPYRPRSIDPRLQIEVEPPYRGARGS